MNKPWYLSLGIWGGVLFFIGGGLTAIGLDPFGQPLMALGGAMGFVGVRRAQK